MPVITKYVCDICGEVTEDQTKVAHINLNSVFGTPVVNALFCKNCWRKFIEHISKYLEKKGNIK